MIILIRYLWISKYIILLIKLKRLPMWYWYANLLTQNNFPLKSPLQYTEKENWKLKWAALWNIIVRQKDNGPFFFSLIIDLPPKPSRELIFEIPRRKVRNIEREMAPMVCGSGDPSGYVDILASYFPQQLFPTIEDSWLNLTSALLCFFSTPPGHDLASQVSLICSLNFVN